MAAEPSGPFCACSGPCLAAAVSWCCCCCACVGGSCCCCGRTSWYLFRSGSCPDASATKSGSCIVKYGR
jgi:hypothetical protein